MATYQGGPISVLPQNPPAAITSTVPRTRADRPFYVDYTIAGLLSGATNPAASKSDNLLRHVQSYGAGGGDVGIDRTAATLLSQAAITIDGAQTLTFALTSIPGADRLWERSPC